MPRLPELAAAGMLLAATVMTASHAATPAADEAAFRSLFRELIEINTTRSVGSCTEAAKAMRARLLAAGYADPDLSLLTPADEPRAGALLAELHGRDPALKPILLLAHLDVVEAKREDWTRDPFRLVEEGGFFYGRGTADDKAMAAVITDTMIRMKQSGKAPKRGLKLALTCAEETADWYNTVEHLTATRPEVLAAEFALNEGGEGELDANGRHVTLGIQAGEKVYQDFILEVTDPGGHSSRPTRENALVRLSRAVVRVGEYQFPVALNEVTRGYFTAEARLVAPDVAADMRALLANEQDAAAAARLWSADPAWNGRMRTTCVPTMSNGGHAPNALPQRAQANVNCRILPGVPIDAVRAELVRVIGDDRVSVRPTGTPGMQAPVPPLTPRIMRPITDVAAKLWPGVAVVPSMSTGATDGRFLNAAGIPTYGLTGLFHDAEGSHMHGLNERVRVQALLDSRQFLYELIVRLSSE